jgi:phosphate transport system substrate-binding protein
MHKQLFPSSQDALRETIDHKTHRQLLEAVSADRSAIGLVNLSRGTADKVRIVPIGFPGHAFVEPSPEAIRTRSYPLVRPLFLLAPLEHEALDEPLLMEFVAYVLSQCGQRDVEKDGFVPLSDSEWRVQEEKLGWHRQQ